MLFENDSIEDQKIKIKDMKSSLDVFSDYFFSDSDLHVTHEKLKINEIFKGELPCAYSVGKLIEIITTLTLAQGQLPECSWSGKSKRKNNVINDVLNPGIFTIRLLSRLGVAIQDTVLKRFLTPYCDEAPVIRGLLIGELYENKDILKLSHNEDLITQLFSEYLGAKNPVYTAQVDTSYYSDLELGLKEKERQVKQLIAQKLALRSVSVSTIFNITGIDVTDTSAPPLKPFNSLSSGKNLINGSPDLFSSKPLVAYNSGTLAAEMTYEQFIKDSQVAHDENSIIG